MNIFEFENQRFSDLWDEKSIEKCRKRTPPKSSPLRADFYYDYTFNDKYREFQEANWNEYFDPAKLYRYCLWR